MFWSHSCRELALRRHVAVLAFAVPLLANVLPLKMLLQTSLPNHKLALYAGLEPAAVVRLVRRRLKHPWVMRERRCLRESLVVFRILRLAGLPAVLCFAVHPFNGGAGRAHCWVMVDGQSINAPAEPPAALVLVYPS